MTARARTPIQQAITGLRTPMRGPVLLEGDNGYDEARRVWNDMFDRRPAAIARCLGTTDVIAAVNFARDYDMPLTVRGGGHNIAGLAVADDALMVDMSLMRGVWVDTDRRVARAQAGCLLADVDRETQLHGLAAPLGFVSNTGIAGLTLGGGFGYLTRRFGWTCDNVTSMEVVTAGGELVRASHQENQDLFWGLRGGGGNFGIVVGFEYQLHEIGPQIYGDAIAWPADQAQDVLDAYGDLAATAPPELTCVLGLRKAPPAPWIQQDMHGRDIVAIFVCYSGLPEQGETLLEPIKRVGSPAGDILQARPYTSQQTLLDATQPEGRRNYWKSEYLGRHDRTMLETALNAVEDMPSQHSAFLFFPIGGELNRLAEDYSPAGNRDAISIFNVAGSWEHAEEDEHNIEWVRSTWQDLRPYATGGTYVNFLTEDEGTDRMKDAYGGNLERLASIKAKWDPEAFFRFTKSIG